MANFDLAFRFMAPHEWNQRRNYTNDPDDPGGPTKFGITLGAWKTLGSLGDLNHDGVVDEKDIILLEEPEARMFYQRRYWIWQGINDDRLAAKLFDIGVNLGPETAVCYLQRALGVTVDGRLGPVTTTAANAANPGQVLAAVCRAQAEHYQDWIAANAKREKYRDGLLARAASLPEVANA